MRILRGTPGFRPNDAKLNSIADAAAQPRLFFRALPKAARRRRCVSSGSSMIILAPDRMSTTPNSRGNRGTMWRCRWAMDAPAAVPIL